jgi:hypothetical protein
MLSFVFFSDKSYELTLFSNQVNNTLTDLDIRKNELGPEGGKAIAKSLEVSFPLSMSALFSSLITSKLIFFVFP